MRGFAWRVTGPAYGEGCQQGAPLQAAVLRVSRQNVASRDQ